MGGLNMAGAKGAGIITFLAIGCLAIGLGAAGEGTEGWNPKIDPSNFVSSIDNPLFPLKPGTVFVYETTSEDGKERIEVRVAHETKVIMGVACTVVRDTVTEGGKVTEDTYDLYAQDKEGNVWYFGEDSKAYKGGKLVGTGGSWEAGVKGAKPGIIMKARPAKGDQYYQEYSVGIAEDEAEVVSLSGAAKVPYGSFSDCLETKEFTALEPGAVEYKFYAPGVGLVLTLEGDAREELVSITSE
jgi:hypothetical protein